MKIAIATVTLALAMMVSNAVLAETAKPQKPANQNVDLTTTQSVNGSPAVGKSPDCNLAGAKFKFASVCIQSPTGLYPENALSGMNLGY